MKKIILFITVSIMSLAASASFAAGVIVEPVPQNPLVINANYTYDTAKGPVTVFAPWFRERYQISSSTTITVVGVQETVTGKNGASVAKYMSFSRPIEIPGSSTLTTDSQIVGSLPSSNNSNYTVTIRPIGWEGSPVSCGPQLNSVSRFVIR